MNKINYQHRNLNVYWIGALAILIALASPWFDLSVSNHSFVKTYIAGIGIGILVLMSLWIKRQEAQTTFHISIIKTTWLSLFVLGTLSVFWSSNADFTITKWFIWFTVLCSFVVGYHLKLNEETFIKLSWGLIFAAFVIAGIGVLQYLFDPFTLTQAAKPASTFGNRNMTTQPIVLIWPLVLFLLFSDKIQNKQVWLLSIMTALMMAFVFYTKTRSSWLSIVGEIILIAGFLLIKRKELRRWISWNSTKTKAVLFSLFLFIIMLNLSSNGWTPFWGGVSNAVASIGADTVATGNPRYNIWGVAIDMIKASPFFGTGLGTWFHNEMQGGFGTWNVSSYQRVHNDTLELGVELGLVGILLLFISVISLTIGSLKIINKDHKIPALFYVMILIALSGSFVQMQFSFPYQLAMPAFLLGLYIGLIAKKSEEFIKPLKLITLKTSAYYHQTIKTSWLVMMIITSAIYIDWVNAYSKLNQINLKQQFDQIENNIPTIYHLEFQNLLGFLSQSYIKHGGFATVIEIEENTLRYWPDSNRSLYRYGHALMTQKRFTDGLNVAKHLKSVAIRGNYIGHILELQLYQKTNQLSKYLQAFLQFKDTDEKLLALSNTSYRFLIELSMYLKETQQYTPDLYEKYKQYHGHICSAENTIATWYATRKKYKEAQIHADIIANYGETCLDPRTAKILKKNSTSKNKSGVINPNKKKQ